MRSLPYLLFLITVPPLSSFNIDVRKSWITPPTAPLSWPKVRQHSDGHETWVLATSSANDEPGRRLGRLNRCSLASRELQCQEVGLRGNTQKSKSIQDGGISLARSAEWILACLQKKRRQALSITEELNGICTLLTAEFQEAAFLNFGNILETQLNISAQNNNNNNNNINVSDADNFTSAERSMGISCAGNNTFNNSRSSHACKDSGMEIAIVLDGSGSIEPEDFERAKAFISKMMSWFWRKCPEVTFAVVQYGAEIRTELDLQESCNRSWALFRVHNITQLGSVTKTASALQHVLDEIFNTSRGSVTDAPKIILVMTDGEIFLDPLRLSDVMSSPAMATIRRYALGVGDAFSKQKALNELQLIASDPDDRYLFKLPDYEALVGFLLVLERSILGTSEEGLGYENQNSNNNNIHSGPEEEEEIEDSYSGTEIAIVLDGSGSIEPEDFKRAKAFISNMMKTFYEKCFECDFALVQYGEEIRTEFDLKDSWNANATFQKVQNITQLGNVTKTASAIQHVLDSIFNESQGSQKNAAKIIVVLTDGEIFLDPMNLTTVINSSKMAGIDRYAIGVGDAFNKPKALSELQLIASDPDESHLFRVTNYSALDGLLSTLQQKIIATEGTAGDITEYELAQTGFSAQILDKQHILVGAVGAFDWSGGVLLYDLVTKTAAFLNESKEAKGARYSYLGYSVAAATTQEGALYIAGAPQHSMTGKVLVFQKDRVKQILQGDQVGSYFGSELCTLDVNRDGLTDHLLVGAPFYHIHGEEGRVYVYRLENSAFSMTGHLRDQKLPSLARFGFALASIGDINGDGYEDVAIGAPLEDQLSDPSAFGSIYIYNGDKDGIRPSFQRIRAAEIAPGLQYFGQSIDGGFDLTEDGLIDITVGSLGKVTVLRSRPVVTFKVTMRFTPERISIFQNNSIVTAELCFDMIPPLKASQQENWHLSIHYTVDLDVKTTKKKRAQFEDQKFILSREEPVNQPMCNKLPLHILPCDYDCFSSITLKVSYNLVNNKENVDHAAPILDKYQEPKAYFQLPYKKDCSNKTICAANLILRSQIQKELVVGFTKELNLNISLVNSGDDSYMTTMVLEYPRNLQFKKMIPEPSPTEIHCRQSEPSTHLPSSMDCKIGHPIFKKATAQFSVIWQLDEARFPDENVNITINITNANENSIPLIEEHTLHVKHVFTAVLTKPTPLLYVNVSQGLPENKEFQFNINGENRFRAEIKLQIWVPVIIQGHHITNVKNVKNTQVFFFFLFQCVNPLPQTLRHSDLKPGFPTKSGSIVSDFLSGFTYYNLA
nr:integrin alpha-E [Pelodiscus sinensis]|eukprot:XP_025035071.1 integrin alpha-E [Pelodiscus sinensis]